MFRESGAFLEGHFRLSSGLHSPGYLQCALVLQHPARAEALGAGIAAATRAWTPTVVLSPALGGIVIGQEVGRALGVRAIFAERTDGDAGAAPRVHAVAADRVLVVEDVLTTGGSTRETIDVATGARRHGGGRGVDHRPQRRPPRPDGALCGAVSDGPADLSARGLPAVRGRLRGREARLAPVGEVQTRERPCPHAAPGRGVRRRRLRRLATSGRAAHRAGRARGRARRDRGRPGARRRRRPHRRRRACGRTGRQHPDHRADRRRAARPRLQRDACRPTSACSPPRRPSTASTPACTPAARPTATSSGTRRWTIRRCAAWRGTCRSGCRCEAMAEAAALFVGEHDFAAFQGQGSRCGPPCGG